MSFNVYTGLISDLSPYFLPDVSQLHPTASRLHPGCKTLHPGCKTLHPSCIPAASWLHVTASRLHPGCILAANHCIPLHPSCILAACNSIPAASQQQEHCKTYITLVKLVSGEFNSEIQKIRNTKALWLQPENQKNRFGNPFGIETEENKSSKANKTRLVPAGKPKTKKMAVDGRLETQEKRFALALALLVASKPWGFVLQYPL